MKNRQVEKNPFELRTERELRDALLGLLRDNGLNPKIEVPFLGRSLDVVYQCADGSITAIEVKRSPKHIRRALDQARICLLGASKVYVCTYKYNMTEELKSGFKNLGVGLIFLSQKNGKFSIKYEISAGRNGRKREEYNSLLRKALT